MVEPKTNTAGAARDPRLLLFGRFDASWLALLLIVTGLVVFKAPDLSLPLYWDEAWSYAPAVRAMLEAGPSLLPGGIDPVLSRGHPLLFHFLATCWMLAFGGSITSMHAFALLISIALLVAVFVLVRSHASPLVAAAATLVLAVNETFLAQSGLLLPEVLLALFVVLSVHFFLLRCTLPYVLAASCALLTKESAVVMVVALLVWATLRAVLFEKDRKGFDRWGWSAIVPLPLIAPLVFFLVQYARSGWFFFPEHIGLLTWTLKDIIYKVKLAHADLFEQQGMVVLTYAFAFAAPVLWRGWNRWWSILVIVLYVAAIKVLVGRWPLSMPLTLVVPAVCFLVVFGVLFLKYYQKAGSAGELACVSFIFVLGFIVFSALNFFANRYLLCALPLVIAGALAVLHIALRDYHWSLLPVGSMVLVILLLSNIGAEQRIGDCELSHADMIRCRKDLVDYCEREQLQHHWFHGSFMDRVYMTDTAAGYLSSGHTFDHVRTSITDTTSVAIFTNEDLDTNRRNMSALGFLLQRRVEHGPAWCELYRRD